MTDRHFTPGAVHCSTCWEKLVYTPGVTKSSWSHDNGYADHDAAPFTVPEKAAG